MQYLHELPNGDREPVTHDEWLAHSIVDKNYQVVMHTPMILVYRTHDMRKVKAQPALRYGGHHTCTRNPAGYGGW